MDLTWEQRNKEQRNAYHREWRKKNKERHKAVKRAWNSANPDKIRKMKYKEQGYPEPTRPCPEVCECCGKPCTRHLNLDHDHTTGKFRGWLCIKCNLGIGKLGDTREGLLKALDYLNRSG